MADQRVYPPDERPDVEVLVDGRWWPGELRAWRRTDTGWVGQVRWNKAPGENYLTSFPAEEIREV